MHQVKERKMPQHDRHTEEIRHNMAKVQGNPRVSGGHETSVPGKGPEKNPTLTAGKGAERLPNASVGKGPAKNNSY